MWLYTQHSVSNSFLSNFHDIFPKFPVDLCNGHQLLTFYICCILHISQILDLSYTLIKFSISIYCSKYHKCRFQSLYCFLFKSCVCCTQYCGWSPHCYPECQESYIMAFFLRLLPTTITDQVTWKLIFRQILECMLLFFIVQNFLEIINTYARKG